MRYNIHYSCWSHVGKCRKNNQDNYICGGSYIPENGAAPAGPISGRVSAASNKLLGIFDGMGGEECGEIASFIAAENAAAFHVGSRPTEDLKNYCMDTNEKICHFASENGVYSMGTTAAVMAFTEKEIALCNIGDSKIFWFTDGKLKQLSEDHYYRSIPGEKPPLSQNLGIPPEELTLNPHVARGRYQNGDTYLICSDGLTDMVSLEEIAEILKETPFEKAVGRLMEKALENGGKDNVTILLCRVERVFEAPWDFVKRILKNAEVDNDGKGL